MHHSLTYHLSWPIFTPHPPLLAYCHPSIHLSTNHQLFHSISPLHMLFSPNASPLSPRATLGNQRIGRVFMNAASSVRRVYIDYYGNHPRAVNVLLNRKSVPPPPPPARDRIRSDSRSYRYRTSL